jgi:hypothetical protein
MMRFVVKILATATQLGNSTLDNSKCIITFTKMSRSLCVILRALALLFQKQLMIALGSYSIEGICSIEFRLSLGKIILEFTAQQKHIRSILLPEGSIRWS